MIELGINATDRITGFTGTVIGHVKYLTGCNQALVVAKSESGKPAESQWFDEQRLTHNKSVPRIVLDNGVTPGCDAPAPRK